jgi:hypothetical protein
MSAFVPNYCPHGSKRRHEHIWVMAMMRAVNHAMVKRIRFCLAWRKFGGRHTDSYVKCVEFSNISKRQSLVTSSRGNSKSSCLRKVAQSIYDMPNIP